MMATTAKLVSDGEELIERRELPRVDGAEQSVQLRFRRTGVECPARLADESFLAVGVLLDAAPDVRLTDEVDVTWGGREARAWVAMLTPLVGGGCRMGLRWL